MSTRNKISAAALAAALLLAPVTQCVDVAAAARTVVQDGDIPSDAEQAMFTKGQNLYNQGRFDQAATVLKDFLKTYPNSIITDLTLLWLGRSYMQLGKIDDAEQIGQRLRTIKDTPFADIYESELMTARREAPARAPATRPSSATTAVATASPVPSPARPASSPPRTTQSGSATSRTNTATTLTPITTPSPASTARNNSNSRTTTPPVARKITGTGPEQVATTTTTAPATNTRNTRSRRQNRRGGQQPVTQPSSTASSNTASTTTPTMTPVPGPSPAAQVATNTPPRNNRSTGSNARTPTTTERSPATISTPSTMAPVNTNPVRPVVTTPPPTTTTATTTTSTETIAPTVINSAPQSGPGLNLTVKQVPNLILALRNASEAASPGQTVQLPLTVQNTGNKEDQFRLETDLPAEYQPSFSLAQSGTDTGLPILVTPFIARNATVDVILNLRVPETATDGQQRSFYVRAASQSNNQVRQVANGSLSIIAAALSAVSNVSSSSVMPGDTFTQTITVRNAGSASARQARADFVFDPNFELVTASPAPIAYDRPSRTAIWSLGELSARGAREINVTLRAVPDALAATNSLGRGMLRTQSLPTASNFDSPSITIGRVPRAEIGAVSVGLTATPGDTVYIPFVVRNPGNSVDAYELRIVSPGAPVATIYVDSNGDGQHQESEAAVTQTGQIDPQGGQYPMLLQVRIPGNTADRQQFSYNIVARSLASNRVASEASTVLTVATPRVRVRTEQVSEGVVPGEAFFYRLVLVNEGSGLAKNLSVTEALPEALQFVNSDPSLSAQDGPGNTQSFTWRVAELAPGDTAVLRVAVRLRSGVAAGSSLTTRHSLSYQDTNGNSYQGQ